MEKSAGATETCGCGWPGSLVHEYVRHPFRDPKRGYGSIRRPNAAVEGHSALAVRLRGKMTDLIALCDWLNAERGAC
jgi:hypothetical protein